MSEIYVDKKVYPTPENYQYSGEATVPLRQLLYYWDKLLKAMPADEAESTTISGHSNVQIWKKYRRSEIEVRDAQRDALLQGLQAAIGDGTITPAELQEVMARAASA